MNAVMRGVMWTTYRAEVRMRVRASIRGKCVTRRTDLHKWAFSYIHGRQQKARANGRW